jgi:CRISPR/Cas system CMR-associated protein Cmr5 small subunit
MALKKHKVKFDNAPRPEGRSRAQRDAARVYALVKAVKGEEDKDARRYEALCHDLPWLLRRSGLAATAGRLRARAAEDKWEGPEAWLLAHLAWALWPMLADLHPSAGKAAPGDPRASMERFTDAAQDLGLAQYLLLTRRALEVCAWLKEYAGMVLNIKPGDRP